MFGCFQSYKILSKKSKGELIGNMEQKIPSYYYSEGFHEWTKWGRSLLHNHNILDFFPLVMTFGAPYL